VSITEQLAFVQGRLTWEVIEARISEKPSLNLYALVDGAQDETLLSRLDKHWPVDAWQSIYAELPEGNSPEVSPLLVSIDPSSNESARVVFKRLLLPSFVKPESILFVWSDDALHELAQHLGLYAEIRTFDDRRALLRFHDPNILPAMLAVQDPIEQAHFFSRIAEIWRPDLDLNWWSYLSELQQPGSEFVAIQWDEGRHRRFADLTAPRKVLQRLEEEYVERITGSREAWRQRIAVWIDQAKTFQVDAFNEQYLYCVTALFAGERFANDLEVVAELHAIGQRHASFIQAIQAVPPEVWERLETALEQ